MRRRHPIPRVWMMTDERMGDRLWHALERLPRGSGVVFRHYGLPERERRDLLRRIVKVAKRRRLVLLAAGGLEERDGVHNDRRRRGLLSRSAHSRREAVAAIRAGADLLFVSPVWPTRSHPGARALGRVRLGLMIRGLPIPVIALGGMTSGRFKALKRLGVYGWAGIDAWLDSRSPWQTEPSPGPVPGPAGDGQRFRGSGWNLDAGPGGGVDAEQVRHDDTET